MFSSPVRAAVMKTSAQVVPRQAFASLEQQFQTRIGPDAITRLASQINNRSVITVGGDQLTGKSTLAKRLAKTLGGQHQSAGTIFRAEAKRRNISLPELSRLALDDPGIDVGIDYELCSMVAQGCEEGPLVIEGRQPAVMATYMKLLGKESCFRLYLTCSFREQALRFLEREIGAVEFQLACQSLPQRNYTSLAEVSEELAKLNIPGLDKILKVFVDNQCRDTDDKQRYQALYNFGDDLDYGNLSLYDAAIDTSPNQPSDTLNQALEVLSYVLPKNASIKLSSRL